jgi:DNA-binding GntR family transcriptional regulator
MGQFVPGHQLTIRPVASSLGVSFTPIRDALSRLVAEGALLSRPRYYSVPNLTIAQAREIYDVRTMLEGKLAEKAAENATEDDIEEIKQLQDRLMRLKSGKPQERLQLNYQFHFRLYDLANMDITRSLVETLWARIGPSLNYLYPSFSSSNDGVHRHDIAIEALESRRPSQVRKAIIEDIDASRRSIEAALKSADGASISK